MRCRVLSTALHTPDVDRWAEHLEARELLPGFEMFGASGYSKKEFKGAMERLFAAGKIVVGTALGTDRHKVKAIIRADQEVLI